MPSVNWDEWLLGTDKSSAVEAAEAKCSSLLAESERYGRELHIACLQYRNRIRSYVSEVEFGVSR